MKRAGIRELLEIAYSIERAGFDIFTRMARNYAKETGISVLFTRLAAEEEDHILMLQKFSEEMKDRTELFDSLYKYADVQNHFKEFSYSGLIKDYKRSIKKQKVLSPVDALRLAIDLEIRNAHFYQKFRAMNLKDEEVTAFLDKLICFELEHMNILTEHLSSCLLSNSD